MRRAVTLRTRFSAWAGGGGGGWHSGTMGEKRRLAPGRLVFGAPSKRPLERAKTRRNLSSSSKRKKQLQLNAVRLPCLDPTDGGPRVIHSQQQQEHTRSNNRSLNWCHHYAVATAVQLLIAVAAASSWCT